MSANNTPDRQAQLKAKIAELKAVKAAEEKFLKSNPDDQVAHIMLKNTANLIAHLEDEVGDRPGSSRRLS